MSSQQHGQDGQNRQSQQSGQSGAPTKQSVQTLISQIEAAGAQSGNFTCSHDQAMSTVLPALKAWNQQQS